MLTDFFCNLSTRSNQITALYYNIRLILLSHFQLSLCIIIMLQNPIKSEFELLTYMQHQ